MIIIDFNGLAIAEFMGEFKGGEGIVIDPSFMRPMFLNAIRKQVLRHRKDYGSRIVIAVDAKKSWRIGYFPFYKWKRQKDKKESKMDWNAFFESYNMVIDDLQKHFPYYTLCVDGAEADDIIGVICHNAGNEPPLNTFEDILIVSSDKDFMQLQRYSNVFQYDPRKKSMVTIPSPTRLLHEHCLRGDKEDGIPNFLSDDDTFAHPDKRQKVLRTTKVDDWLAMPFEKMYESFDDEQKKNFDRNRRLIDLDQIPRPVQRDILKSLNNTTPADRSNLFNYFFNNGLTELLDCISEF